MCRTPSRRDPSFVFVCVAALVVLVGCSKDPPPAPARAAPEVGTVRAKQSTPSTCPASGSCILFPSEDTTVYSGTTIDFGAAHELCAGPGVRALLRFNMA